MELKEVITKLEKSKIKAGDGKKVGKYPLYTCSPTVDKFYDEYLYDTEAIILSTGGNPVVNYYNGKFSYSTDCLVIQSNETLECKYMYYYLLSKIDIIGKMFRGVGIKHLNKNEFLKLDISIVDKESQNKIIANLDIVNTIIELKKEQLKEYDNIVKSQFVEMFGDPISNPMKWKVKKLGELSNKVMSGNTPKGGDRVYVSSGIEFYRSQNVWKNKIEKDDIAYIDEETHKRMLKSSLKHNDLLITKTGRINTENSSLGRTALYVGEDDKANINGHVYLVRLNKGENHEFILRILISDEYREYIRSVCVGGIDKRQLNKEHIENFPIIYPPIELQNQFADIVKQIDKQKFEIEKSLKEMQELYESLMEKYFG